MKIHVVPLLGIAVKMLAIPPFWTSNKTALGWANHKSPLEVVVVN